MSDTGVFIPVVCPRKRTDCKSLEQVVSDNEASFVCCGAISEAERVISQDRFRVCWKNETVDEMGDYDDADMKDTISVLSQALSADEHIQRSKT